MAETNHSKKGKFLLRAAKIILPLALAAVCLYYILTSFEWLEIWRTIRQINLSMFLAASISTTLIFWFLRTLRWAILLKNEKLNISFFKLYLYTAVTIGFANFTPFQSGEALKVEFLRKYGGGRFSGYRYFFFEKLLDLLTISTLAAFGIFVLFEFNLGNRLQLAIAGLIAVLAVLIFAFVIASKKFPEKLQTYRRIVPTQSSNLIFAFLLTLASWTIMIFGWKFIFQSAAIDLTIFQTTAIISLTTVIGILSFVPGAIGVSEISIAAMLSQMSYATVTAQTGAMMIALYSLVILILSSIHLIILKMAGAVKIKESC
ncbi:MAG: flippase-like domain-containing protein [Pyrinomonadaceae bacterium]|nr:flippase-like domain-containing protein [Pyrinomonadaceae bacterium]